MRLSFGSLASGASTKRAGSALLCTRFFREKRLSEELTKGSSRAPRFISIYSCMQWLGNLVGFFLAGVLGFVSTTSLYPLLFYAIPKALFWAARGLFKWKLLFHLVREGLTTAVVLVIFSLVGSGLLVLLLQLSEEAWGAGVFLGVISGIITILSREGIAVLRMGFIRAALPYFNQRNPSAPVLLAEFRRRNPVDREVLFR